jgi:hypothetical protein
LRKLSREKVAWQDGLAFLEACVTPLSNLLPIPCVDVNKLNRLWARQDLVFFSLNRFDRIWLNI